MTDFPIYQSPYDEKVASQFQKEMENRAFFRMCETAFSRRMLKAGASPEREISYETTQYPGTKRERIVSKTISIRASDIACQWSIDEEKWKRGGYKKEKPEQDYFVQSQDIQKYLDICNLRYVPSLRNAFLAFTLNRSSYVFLQDKEILSQHREWFDIVCGLVVEEAILLRSYDIWLATGINHFHNEIDMPVKIGQLLIERGIVKNVCIAENHTLKTVGLGAEVRHSIEKSIIDDKTISQDERESKLQKVLDDRSKVVRDNWEIIKSDRDNVVQQVSQDLHAVEQRWRDEVTKKAIEENNHG